MVCFIRATELNVGKQYIYYDYITLDILGTYLENGNFEYQNPSSLFDLYELSAADTNSINSISFKAIEAHIEHINSTLELYTGSYAIESVQATREQDFIRRTDLCYKIANYNKPPVDPKLLRLREMLKKI